jgi:DNA-binding SARP family transcriptional activator/tetratricopeptide (TPR) repeat protein
MAKKLLLSGDAGALSPSGDETRLAAEREGHVPTPPQSRLRVSVLGAVRAWVDDREIGLGPARQRALFAMLAANANRLVGRDELIEAIWGTSPPATAAGSVYTYVSGLRRSLEPDRSRRPSADLLTSGPSGYSLRLDPADLDAGQFQRLRGTAAELLSGGDAPAAVARLDAALALWHGDAYAGLTGPFIELDRQRLAELRLSAVEQRARIILDLGGDDALVAELAGLVQDNPLHEPLHELLMRALYQAGRLAEALEVFRNARRALVDELGVEPGPALRELQRRVLAGSADAPAPAVARELAPTVVPAQVARAMRDGLGSRVCVGREDELAYLRGLVRAVAAGTGGAVWIDGEPGIGKTELLTQAFGDAAGAGVQLAWGAADELGQRVPLQIITRALGLETSSPHHRLAELAARLHGVGGEAEDVGPAVAVDRVLAYVRSTCGTAPLILVVDDMQWADATSVLLWERLLAATSRLPLLLVASARPEPHSRELAQLRRGVQARQRRPVDLRPLREDEMARIVSALVGAPIGPNLRALAVRAAGNPLYAREMVAALLRTDAVRVDGGVADIDATVGVAPPESLLAAVRATLDFLTEETQKVLRLAALLGTQFAVSDVVAVTGRSPFDLMSSLEEALSANVVVDAGPDLAFRHPFLRQALQESVPAAMRAGLHRHTAEVLAAGGGSVIRVAEQLAAESPVIDTWVVGWLADRHAEVTKQVPQIAGDLIRLALATDLPSPAQRETLLVALVKMDFRRDLYPIAEAAQALELATDPADRAEMRQLLAAMRFRRGDQAAAIGLLRDAVHDPQVPPLWRTRHRVLLANFRRGDLDDLDRAERTAARVHAEAVAAGQPYEAAFALQTVWLTSSIRRDHERALAQVDRALEIMRDDPDMTGMYFDLLDNKMFSLQNLDRLDAAQRTLREAALFAIQHQLPAGLQVATAVQYYWLGRWDDAMAEVSAVTDDAPGITFHGMREPGAFTMLLHGVAALITLHRGASELAAAHLDAADALPASEAERENCDFLLVARALAAEQQDRAAEALFLLGPLLLPGYAPMMLRHQWLPDVTRLALAAGQPETAERAATICAAEAAKEVLPARAWAASARCRALLSGDPGPAVAAAEHYRAVGRVPERAAALEDAAVLLAGSGRAGESISAAREAAGIFAAIGATWDVERVRRRLEHAGLELDGALPAHRR